MKKKVGALLVSVILAASMLAGCSSPGGSSSDGGGKTYKVGISQFAEHPSLDNCRKGFLEGLASAGIVEGKNLDVTTENAQTDMGTAQQIAQNFVSKNYDLICGIATPSAQAAYNAASASNIPVIFNAVTDPVAAGLAKADGSSVGNVTGVSDALPVEAQLKTIREILPDAKKIGILYTTSEVNSVSTLATYKKLAPKYGFTIVDSGISAIGDVPNATDAILKKVDCLTNLTDNTVVSALPTILDKANAVNIPVFGSEIEQVKMGCLAGEGIDYVALGKQAGEMAAQVLKGEKKASDIPYETVKKSNLYINDKAASDLGISIPQSASDRATDTFKVITAK